MCWPFLLKFSAEKLIHIKFGMTIDPFMLFFGQQDEETRVTLC